MIDTKLETAENKYGLDVYGPMGGKITTLPIERVAESVVLQNWPPFIRNQQPPPTGTLLFPPVPARAEHGRWLAQCPFCNSAQVTDPNDKRFFCVECSNAGLGGWLTVEWPDNVDELEEALVQRAPINQVWNPGETVEDLHEENAAHITELTTATGAPLGAFMQEHGTTQAQQAAMRSMANAAAAQDEALAQGETPAALENAGELAPPPPPLPVKVAGLKLNLPASVDDPGNVP